MKSCAICTTPSEAGQLEPLGRNDALVWVCFVCSGGGVELEPSTDRRRRHKGYSEARAKRDLRPGAKLFRVRLTRRHQQLTAAEAWNFVIDQTGVRLLGADNRWAYFERRA